MKQEVIAIFDIGKTNKKFILFNKKLEILHQEETVFKEIKDEDGYPCDDIVKLVAWIKSTVINMIDKKEYDIKYLNFTTYGASLVYLDDEGLRLTPLYNYLKPMPKEVLEGFYEKHGGKEEFSRRTASPALDMLNSGLQALWLKKKKPEVWAKVKHILHLPQFISYLFTNVKIAGYPSIGCHTVMWDFDNMQYHPWLKKEGIELPEPVPPDAVYRAIIGRKIIKTGVGIHDSSASLVPYFRKFTDRKFVLVSTGTWAINMNPFSTSTLTADELQKDCLCYLSVYQNQVKSSRLFLGHIHQVNAEMICEAYNVDISVLQSMQMDNTEIKKVLEKDTMMIFPDGVPADYKASKEVLSSFENEKEAYHQFIYELTKLETEAISLVFDKDDETEDIFVTGGFVKNEIFCTLLATFLPDKKVYRAELYNATALGAAMIIYNDIDVNDIDIILDIVNPLS